MTSRRSVLVRIVPAISYGSRITVETKRENAQYTLVTASFVTAACYDTELIIRSNPASVVDRRVKGESFKSYFESIKLNMNEKLKTGLIKEIINLYVIIN